MTKIKALLHFVSLTIKTFITNFEAIEIHKDKKIK
jgi:hypothetical protein